MSLNIMDTFFDRLSLASKDRNIPLGKKFTGSRNFLGTNNSFGLSQSIPSEISRSFMDPEYFNQANNQVNLSSSLDSKMNYLYYQTSDRLVSRVSKLLSPMFAPQDCFRMVPNSEFLQNEEILNKVVFEEFEQHLSLFSKMFIPDESASFKFESPFYKQSKDFNSVPDKVTSQENLSDNIDNISNQTKVMNSGKNSSCQPKTLNIEPLSNNLKEMSSNVKTDPDIFQETDLSFVDDSFLQNNMPDSCLEIDPNPNCQPNLPANKSRAKSNKNTSHQTNYKTSVEKSPNQVIMQETTSTMQKNKKQLNCNHTMNKELTNRKNKELHKRSKKRRRRQKKTDVVLNKPQDESKRTARQTKSSGSSDILCDITIDNSSSSVQILLPNTSSFVISIEDESDWDSSDDCDWLTDSSEFELSGIFISNLSLPMTSSLSRDVCFSQLSVPPCSYAEEMEMFHLGAALRRVNMDWIESTKGLDSKPKVATKVSFAPEDRLVEVLHVEIYERKGEWETYACERMRFKRRIDELKKIISPCLSKEHREKVFLKLQAANL